MKSLVVAPHPDDEILGVGGTILKRKDQGHEIAWLILTDISEEKGWDKKKVETRRNEINEIEKFYKFDEVFKLGFPAAYLDTIPLADLISKVSSCLQKFQPEEIFIPFRKDVHSDHRVVFHVMLACTKWFRYPFLKKVLSYETLSETNFNFGIKDKFSPNFYVDVSQYLEKKIKSMEVYKSEISDFPFPRSKETIRYLAKLRGSEIGVNAAEAFELIIEKC